RRHGRRLQIRRVGMPDAAEVYLLVLELLDLDDLRKALDAFDEGIFDHLAKTLGDCEELRRRQILIAKEDDEMVEPNTADFRDGLVVEGAREIDAGNLRPDGAAEAVHFDGARCGREHAVSSELTACPRPRRRVRRSSAAWPIARPRRGYSPPRWRQSRIAGSDRADRAPRIWSPHRSAA